MGAQNFNFALIPPTEELPASDFVVLEENFPTGYI